jgi:site-specific recombinase XerD
LNPHGAEFFQRHCLGRAGHELMFVQSDGRVWGRPNQCRLMRAACERAAITSPIGFHGLRHTWASLAVMNGVPLMVVRRI